MNLDAQQSGRERVAILDPGLELQRTMNGLSYERFIHIHWGCPGIQDDGKVATCSTHKNVKSAEAPEGYISK